MKIIPTKKGIGNRFKQGLYGAGAGAVNSVLSMVLGSTFLGTVIGSTIVGAMADDTVGTIIAVNGYMDATESLLLLGR